MWYGVEFSFFGIQSARKEESKQARRLSIRSIANAMLCYTELAALLTDRHGAGRRGRFTTLARIILDLDLGLESKDGR